MSSVRPGTASRLRSQQQQQQQQKDSPQQNLAPPGRPTGTASRLTTGMRGGGSTLNQSLRVEDRPITQQGLGGMKSMGRGPTRRIEDKSYYIGVLRRKINEITVELGALNRQIKDATEENTSFVQYEKMAEKVAQDIKNLQGEMGDYNTLVDKLTTDEDLGNVQLDYEDLKAGNERIEKSLELLFEEKSRKEDQLKQLEIELEQERRLADTLVSNMPSDMRQRYQQLKHLNEHLLKQLDKSQQDMDQLSMKKTDLEEELSSSQMKQEAYRLYEQLRELREKRDQLIEETQSHADPQQERERLLARVKDDNQELVTIERQTNELKERLAQIEEELRNTDQDIQDTQSDRNQKYRELKKREEQMDDFMASYEENKRTEEERMDISQSNIVTLLERISRNMAREGHMNQLPTSSELSRMKEQLQFKQQEVKKSESTTQGLSSEHAKLQMDLMKVDQLEIKISQEKAGILERIDRMEAELKTISNIDQLKAEGEEKYSRLLTEKDFLSERRGFMKRLTQRLSKEYEALNKQLQENDTHVQLAGLERRWTHLEQNNFVMKEFIASKNAESDYETICKRVKNSLLSMNAELIKDLAKGTSGI